MLKITRTGVPRRRSSLYITGAVCLLALLALIWQARQSELRQAIKGMKLPGKGTFSSSSSSSKKPATQVEKKPTEKPFPNWKDYPRELGFFGGLKDLRPPDREDVPRTFTSPDPRQPPDNGGQRKLDTSMLYDPYPDYNGRRWRRVYRGRYVPCVGPRGKTLDDSLDDEVFAYNGVPKDFPYPDMGSHRDLNLDGNVCFDRYSRLGAYGYGDRSDEGAVTGWIKPQTVRWQDVKWGQLQDSCLERNADRYDLTPRQTGIHTEKVYDRRAVEDERAKEEDAVEEEEEEERAGEGGSTPEEDEEAEEPGSRHKQARKRHAILLRTFTGYKYEDNDVQNLRSLIQELSLKTGGEYQVYLFVHVKDPKLDFRNKADVAQRIKEQHVPKEFHDIVVLWSMQTSNRYPLLKGYNDVHISQWFGVQEFSRNHPNFDFYWNWEMDTRYLGHNYHFVDTIGEWAKAQPRRGMWERNERLFIPKMHGSYDAGFRNTVTSQAGNGVWDPPFAEDVAPIGPRPPVKSAAKDNFEWGVGEDADLITFLPLFNPPKTNWIYRNLVWGYHKGKHQIPAKETRNTPRRTTIVTQTRLSKRLLDTMHFENVAGRHMSAEMWPQSCALLHGWKAVYAPHPIWMDRKWPSASLDRVFNPGDKHDSGSVLNSPFSLGNENAFFSTSWYYRSDHVHRMYWNWLGWEWEKRGGTEWEAQHGRMCLPPMFVHPVKAVHK